jgi:hypothetical protein
MERWTDERLDDRFRAIEAALQAHQKSLDLLADTGMRVVRLDGHVLAIAEDTKECREGVRELAAALKKTADALAAQELAQSKAKLEEREQLGKERKSDRRWLIGTVLTVLALVVATFSVLAATGVFT